MTFVPLSASFQSLPWLPTIKLGHSGADSRVGGLVYVLGPCGSLQRPLSPVRLGVSPAASTPTGVFSQRFETLFPTLEPWVVQSVSLLDVPPGLSALKCGSI